jgi:hypothetical protein
VSTKYSFNNRVAHKPSPNELTSSFASFTNYTPIQIYFIEYLFQLLDKQLQEILASSYIRVDHYCLNKCPDNSKPVQIRKSL